MLLLVQETTACIPDNDGLSVKTQQSPVAQLQLLAGASLNATGTRHCNVARALELQG